MPLSISAEDLGVALRIGTTTGAIQESHHLTELTRLHRVTEFTIDDYAPEAPQAIQDEAAVIMAGYLYEAPPHSRSPQNAFTNSGAKALLAPWQTWASAKVGEAEATTTAEEEEEMEEMEMLRYVGWSMDGTIDAADFDAGTSFAVETDSVDVPAGTGNLYLWAASPVGHVPASVSILIGTFVAGGMPRADDLVYNGISYAVFRSSNALTASSFTDSTVRFNA